MNIQDEKLLLLKALVVLQSELKIVDNGTSEIFDIADRIKNLTHCLIELNWAELDRRKLHD